MRVSCRLLASGLAREEGTGREPVGAGAVVEEGQLVGFLEDREQRVHVVAFHHHTAQGVEELGRVRQQHGEGPLDDPGARFVGLTEIRGHEDLETIDRQEVLGVAAAGLPEQVDDRLEPVQLRVVAGCQPEGIHRVAVVACGVGVGDDGVGGVGDELGGVVVVFVDDVGQPGGVDGGEEVTEPGVGELGDGEPGQERSGEDRWDRRLRDEAPVAVEGVGGRAAEDELDRGEAPSKRTSRMRSSGPRSPTSGGSGGIVVVVSVVSAPQATATRATAAARAIRVLMALRRYRGLRGSRCRRPACCPRLLDISYDTLAYFVPSSRDGVEVATEQEASSLRDRNRERTRLDVINAYADLSLERGFNSFTMQDVADRVGISHRTLYRYFDNRDAIAHELNREIAARVYAPGDNRAEDPAQALRHNYKVFGEYRKAMLVCALMMEAGMLDSPHRHARSEYLRRVVDQFAPALGETAKRQLFGLLRVVAGALAWARMTSEEVGLSDDEAGAASAWALEVLLDAASKHDKDAL